MNPHLELLPRVLHDLECSGETHQLVWSKGVFTTLDHADPEGERTLHALGGPSSRCLDVLDAWNRHRQDLRMLVLASRGPTDRLGPTAEPMTGLQFVSQQSQTMLSRALRPPMASRRGVHTHVGGWISAGVQGTHVYGEPESDEELLFGLGGGLPERLAAEVAAHWTDRLDDGDQTALPALTAALYGRVAATLDGWLGTVPDLELTMVGPDQTPSYERSAAAVQVRLPFAWVSRVWAPGLAVTAGQFVLDARVDGSHLHLQAVDPDGGDPATVTISRTS